MSSSPRTITITVMGTPYQIACPDDRTEDLETAANYLETRIREVLDSSQLADKNRVLLMVSLNLCDELLNNRKAYKKADEQQTLRRLHSKLDTLIVKQTGTDTANQA